jgi:hypothetical protein
MLSPLPFTVRFGRWQLRDALAMALLAALVAAQWGLVLRAALSPSQTVARAGSHAADGAWVFRDCVASGKGGKAPGSQRDCRAGEGADCTREQPCTPCTDDLAGVNYFGSAGGAAANAAGAPCVACAAGANFVSRGDCGFVEGFGPYCRYVTDAATGATEVRACERCCKL